MGGGAAARVPDGGALQEHLLPVPERVPALGAARARRVEVVVLPRLQHLRPTQTVHLHLLPDYRSSTICVGYE